jgi:fructose-specific phosphotransferase system IIC component
MVRARVEDPMKALLVFFVLPTLIGVVSTSLIRAIRGASLAAAVGAPLVVFLYIRILDPEDMWTWLAALLVSPLVMAIAVIATLLCVPRSHVRKRDHWNDA